MNIPIISIIIVNYKSGQELIKCITSIKKTVSTAYEIIVVDNDEKNIIEKNLKKNFSDCLYIKSKKNRGFGAGNNLGAKYAKGKYLFFLNPDTVLLSNALETLVKFLENNQAFSAAAPLLLDEKRDAYPLQGARTLTPLRAIFSFSFFKKLFPNNKHYKDYWLIDSGAKKHEVDVIPGSSFLIRKDTFNKIGGFDENFFLYFEENDLCKRIRDSGFKIAFISDSKVIHFWGKSTEKSSFDLKKIYLQSLHYYIKKHYGLLWAIIIDFMMYLTKENLLLLAIFIIGFYLRFKNVQLNLGFDAEVGDNLLDIKNAYLNHQILLHGPPTSHPWLYFPPLFYWIYGTILILSGFNPISHSYYGVVVSCLTLITMYLIIKSIFNKKIALISIVLLAASPLFLFASIIGRFIYTVPLIALIFYFLLFKLAQGKKQYLIWVLLCLGIMLNFHYTPIFFIPAIITIILIKKIKYSLKEYFLGLIAFILPLFPLIVFDSKHHFSMLINFALWFPYRVAGFLGLYHKKGITSYSIKEDTTSLISFFSQAFNSQLGTVLALITLGYFVYLLYRLMTNNDKMSNGLLVLVTCLFWGILATSIHGSPPLHYFVPIFPIPLILFSHLSARIYSKNVLGKILIILLLCIFLTLNIADGLKPVKTYLTYSGRQKIARYIVSDAKNEKFSLKRIGYNDRFDKQFAQNYIYLLWWYGNEPVKKASLIYIIVEETKRMPKLQNSQIIKTVENVEIVKVKKV